MSEEGTRNRCPAYAPVRLQWSLARMSEEGQKVEALGAKIDSFNGASLE